MADMKNLDRYRGCLLGLAVGDAIGTTVEFKPRGTFPPVTGMVGGGAFNLQPGQWMDDTSMALCLAESLVAKGGFDALDQMQRYLAWSKPWLEKLCLRERITRLADKLAAQTL
jgi:ADP-ribosyl-[dinitrogen reductase] hydrolase